MARIVANMASNNIPITGLDELDAHLDSLIDNPSLDIQSALFDHVELQLTGGQPLSIHHIVVGRHTD